MRECNRSAEAVVSDVQGKVEGRAPVEPKWSDRTPDDILVEFERVRTLSASATQITFRDLSRLRLNANSNATIQRMRSDPLTGGEVTKVSLANGDFYALLNQLSDKSTFEIDVPGVETTTNSANFWIKNDDSGARFVNCDAEDLEIERNGEPITVGENDGVVLSDATTAQTEALTAPLPQAPGVGDLAKRFNAMISQLAERLELMKFVSCGTKSAIQKADQDGMHRGGERRRVSVIFTDIRGYTEFSECVPPKVVIEALNQYFVVQNDIVADHGGDFDKFVGDALVVVFEDKDMEARAVSCSVGIAEAMVGLLEKYPDYDLHVGIGVASGEVVMDATGAWERMDFTVLGSTVNLSARLCSKADPGQVLLDQATRDAATELRDVEFIPLEPLPLKVYADPVSNFSASRHGDANIETA